MGHSFARWTRQFPVAAVLALLPLAGHAAPASVGESGISLAVLPLANPSGDAGQEAFADGMTDEIGATLARIDGLHVGARASAFRYKAQTADSRAIGQFARAIGLVDGWRARGWPRCVPPNRYGRFHL